MPRVSVIGSSGSGKTTFARELSRRLEVPHVELDGVMHQAGWVPLDVETFQARVRARAAEEHWVIDGNYGSRGATSIVWARAQAIVWLDPPRSVVMRRVVSRTLRRLASGEVLWNGNRERWQNLFDPRPEENVVLWAWTRFDHVRRKYGEMMRDGTWAGRLVFHLRDEREKAAFLAGCERLRGWI